ncbi:acetyl-CoA acetyltransferase [Phenylobacterium sp. LjRoot219]|uniref:acetyl-CoA acetyltransferase n=1 Tax=Phenylobacterium sp. LjRoot219 TaxID=3342283 RepID=UPI003ED13AE6
MRQDPTRTPVIVGVGEINDRPAAPEQGLDSVQLMLAALQAADADAGGGFLARCDRLYVVPQISFRQLDPAELLARALGLPPERIRQAEQASGDTPIRHLNDAANAIASGEAEVCLVTGGEALRTAAARARAAGGAELFQGSRQSAPELRRKYGLVTPAEIYPLFENATRAAWGQTLAEAQAETAQIWSRMSEVAGQASGAWLKQPRSPAEILEVGPANRPVAFPYSKLMVANPSVNQGAALVVTSLAAARAAGIAEARMVFIGAGAAAHEPDEPLARADWGMPPGLTVAITRALALNGLAPEALDMAELYSCFPCVPKMARRVLGWPLERPVTVHGGLTFGGGPIGNYMTHAAAAMVRRLRAGGRNGLLFANGGHCTHNHALVLTRDADAAAALPQGYDFQAEADRLRGPIPPVTDAYEGPVTVETYALSYDAQGAPAAGVVISRNPRGERVLARADVEDAGLVAWLTDGRREPVGAVGTTRRRSDALYWRPGAA